MLAEALPTLLSCFEGMRKKGQDAVTYILSRSNRKFKATGKLKVGSH